MGTTLTGKRIKDTYLGFIKTTDNSAVDATGKQLSDGGGNDIGVYLATGGKIGISGTPDYVLDASASTDAVHLPQGTTGTRPTGAAGIIRYNTTESKLEYYDSGFKLIASEDYVSAQITALIDSSPAALDTLNELAAALNDDASFHTTITNLINTKQDTVTGAATTIVSSNLTASRVVVSNGSGKVAVSDVTSTELGYLDGVTSAVQTQIDSKQATITGAATTIDSEDLTASRAVISNGSGKVAVSAVTDTELGYLDGVTSAIQTQIDSKQATITGAATTIDDADLTASRAIVSSGSGKVAVSAVTSTELGYLDGVTSSIQTQIDSKYNYTISAADGDNTDEEKIVLTGSDSSTDAVVLEAGTGLTIARSGDKITFTNTVTDSDTVLTTEQVEDIVGAMVSGNTESGGIVVTYDDSSAKLNFAFTLADDAVVTAKILDGNVTLAKIADQAANTIIVRDANSSGDLSAKAVADTEILIGDGSGFTAASLSGDVTMTNAGAVTIANDAVDADKLANSINTEIAANTAKVTNATHTGDVTGSTSLTIADNAVSLAKMAGLARGKFIFGDESGDPAALAAGADGKLLIADADGDPSWTTVSGDATLSAGAITIANDAITGAKIHDSAALPNGVTATTQSASDNSTKVATTAYVDTAVSAGGGGGGVEWETTAKTSGFTAVSGKGYFVDTSSGAVTVTLPSSPSAGDLLGFLDYAATFQTNSAILTSSKKILASNDDMALDGKNQMVELVFSGDTKGWLISGAANEGTEVLSAAPIEISCLVVAGGGGGSSTGQNVGGTVNLGGGGGGAGEFLVITGQEIELSSNYTVGIGAGGANTVGSETSGSDTKFLTAAGQSAAFNYTCNGGGRGAKRQTLAADGGSGGGGIDSSGYTAGGDSVKNEAGFGSLGNDGGDGQKNTGASIYAGGGGRGAGAAGQDGASDAGDGGVGYATTISSDGSSTYYAGGGGGGGYAGTDGVGGNGGGGDCGSSGTANTGGGGGGGTGAFSGTNSGNGGSGVVIIKYPDTLNITVGGSLTSSTDTSSVSGFKITTFTAGEDNISWAEA